MIDEIPRDVRDLINRAARLAEKTTQGYEMVPVELEPPDATVEQAAEVENEPLLKVDLGRKTLTLGDKTYECGSDLALRWVKVLADNEGVWISSTELKDHDDQLDGARPDKFRHKLPRQVLDLIDSNRSKGSRIRRLKKTV